MRKGGKTTSSLKELAFKIFISKDFQDKTLPRLREEFGIPEEGFFVRDNPEMLQEPERTEAIKGQCAYEKWVIATTGKIQEKLHRKLEQICKKHNLPANAELTLAEYICIGPMYTHSLGFMDQHAMEVDFYPLHKNTLTERSWNKARMPYVRIYLSSSMSQLETLKTIKGQWKVIETLWEAQGWKANQKSRRNKQTKDKEVVYRSAQLMKKDKKELIGTDKITKTKTFLVRDRLKREFPDKYISSPEAIERKTYRKQKIKRPT